MSTAAAAPSPMESAPANIPRLVQIGLNLIGVLNIDDKTHSWTGLVIMHVFWDPTPWRKGHAFFRPWIQVHNVKTVEELENPGMIHLSDEMLTEKVQRNDTSVHESRNFVAEFISELDLRDFPFDFQKLRITIVSNTTSDTTFTHKMGRRDPAKRMACERPKTTLPIKCNLEADLLSEWSVMLQDGDVLQMGESTPGVSSVAAVNYVFSENDRALSAMGAIYQRMDMYLVAVREVRNMVSTICFPSALLAGSSLCIFSLDGAGDRFSVLFSIILTIVASQFVTQEKLPALAYTTWMDSYLLSLQVFVYLMVLQTALLSTIAEQTGTPAIEVDRIFLIIFAVLYVVILAAFGLSALRTMRRRDAQLAAFVVESSKCFEREEARLHHLWYPNEAPGKDYVPQVDPEPPARRRSSAAARAAAAAASANKVDNLVPVQDTVGGKRE